MIGSILGNRYEIIEKIGSGGMAVVYKAHCRLLNRFVAIKVLRDELKDDKQFVEKFRQEAQAAASLTHPNIVSVYDVGEENGIYYFVMEYIEGVTLKEIINSKGALNWKLACEFAVGICSAIEHAHKNNIVHRDIKPHNIMINAEGNVKVTDFGIARAVSSSTIVRGGNVIGSVHYFSPEQAQGGVIDFKSDIYSIGIVLYEMLTGHVPFDADTPFAVAKMQVDTEAVPVYVANPAVPRIVSDITMKAIAKQPQMRYQSVTMMIADLKRALAGELDGLPADTEATQFIPQVDNDQTTFVPPQQKSQYQPPKAEKPPQTPKDKKAVVFAWITAIVILVVAGVGVAYLLSPDLFQGQDTVPKVIGMSEKDASERYQGDFTIVITDQQYNDEYEEGIIIAQDPAENTSVELPCEIKVTVSLGKKDLILRDYSGMDYETAKKEIEAMDLKVEARYDKHETTPRNTVYRQSPAEKSQMKAGDTVILYVSDGPEIETVKVPNIIGMTQSAAIDELRKYGLNPGDFSTEESTMDKGRVCGQDPTASTEINEGSEVDIVISEGVKATPSPSPTPRSTPEPTPTSTPTQTQAPAETAAPTQEPAANTSAEPEE